MGCTTSNKSRIFGNFALMTLGSPTDSKVQDLRLTSRVKNSMSSRFSDKLLQFESKLDVIHESESHQETSELID